MKTIANIMIINSQNVKPEHLVISSHHNISFQRRKLCLRQDEFQRSRQHWAARTAAGWPEIFDMRACSYRIAQNFDSGKVWRILTNTCWIVSFPYQNFALRKSQYCIFYGYNLLTWVCQDLSCYVGTWNVEVLSFNYP